MLTPSPVISLPHPSSLPIFHLPLHLACSPILCSFYFFSFFFSRPIVNFVSLQQSCFHTTFLFTFSIFQCVVFHFLLFFILPSFFHFFFPKILCSDTASFSTLPSSFLLLHSHLLFAPTLILNLHLFPYSLSPPLISFYLLSPLLINSSYRMTLSLSNFIDFLLQFSLSLINRSLSLSFPFV